MTRADSPPRAAGKTQSNKTENAEKPVLIEPVPMKPRRGLLVLLSIVFVCWVGWLVATYVSTVRPREREQGPPTSEPSRGVAVSSMPAWRA